MKRIALHIRRWKWYKQNEQFNSVFITWWGYHSQLETAWFIIMFMWQLCSISGFVNKLFGCLYVDVVTDAFNFRFVNKLFARVMIGKLYSEINRFYSSACTTHPIFAHFSESDSITTICVWWLTTLLFTMFSDPVIRVM